MKKVSIIIPSYNEATYVGRLLDALSVQQYSDFEVIVSDALSRDNTKSVVRSYQTKLDIKLLENPPNGPAAGRNIGAKAATGEWLLFLDADVDIDDQQFIATILNEAKQNNWQTVTTKLKTHQPSLGDKLGMKIHYGYLKLLSHTQHPVAPGFCILTWRKLFEENNGFDETLWVGEDYDYVSRVGRSHGFGFTNKTYYFVDLRRFEEGGKFKVFLQSIGYEIYRFTHNFRIEKDPFNYKFGHHKLRK